MSWRTFTLAFKQKYEGGYRYLDRCGEFMLEAEERLNFMSVDAKPIGAKFEMPEHGIKCTVDASELFLLQELPGDDSSRFLSLAQELSSLAEKHFTPRHTSSIGLALRSFWPLNSADQALAASLHLKDPVQMEMGKTLGMVPRDKKLDFHFTSGSMLLHVSIEALTFEKIAVNRQNPNFSASHAQKEKIDRINKGAERFQVHLSHALSLDLDLIESDPPKDSLKNHYDQLMSSVASLRKQFSLP